jgi:hypothetical protein
MFPPLENILNRIDILWAVPVFPEIWEHFRPCRHHLGNPNVPKRVGTVSIHLRGHVT